MLKIKKLKNNNKYDFTIILSKLLSNKQLRDKFKRNPEKVISEFSLNKTDSSMLLSISIKQLEIQARILLNKRLHEVKNILPNSFSFNTLLISREFYCYAENYWPSGYQKHFLDARRFCCYLKHKKISFDHSELNRIQFSLNKKFFTLHVHKKLWLCGKPRFVIQLFYRFKTSRKEFQLYFGF